MSLISSIQSLSDSFTKAAQPGNLNEKGISSTIKENLDLLGQTERLENLNNLTQASRVGQSNRANSASFEDILSQSINAVDAVSKNAQTEVQVLMVGESDNLHQSVIAMQEAGVAFTLMVEVRNKLLESYQELMRMQI